MILSSSSSGVVRKVSDSLLGMGAGKLSAKLGASRGSDAEHVAPFSAEASRWGIMQFSLVWDTAVGENQPLIVTALWSEGR